jgi:hypothetical protein
VVENWTRFATCFIWQLFHRKLKSGKIRKLGVAHEKQNYRQFLKNKPEEGERPDSLASVMDLVNNELGFAIGCNFRNLNLSDLREKVTEAITLGKAVILKRDQSGQYVDCSGQPINPVLYQNKWYVPKCLVNSNHNNSN